MTEQLRRPEPPAPARGRRRARRGGAGRRRRRCRGDRRATTRRPRAGRRSTARTRRASRRRVQGHLHFASFDVTTTDRAALVALLQDWTAAARDMTANRPVGGARPGQPPRAAVRHRRGASAWTPRTSPSPSASGRRCSTTASGWRAATGRARRPAGVPRRHARPGPLRRRPGDPGLLRRPAGRGARGPQPDPDRRRPGRGALGAARLRQGVVHRPPDPTPRNLFGFKDGTANVLGDDDDALREQVWARRSRRQRRGWPAAPTSSRGGSG